MAVILFPSIDRPSSFSFVIPIHTLGLRLQGQNLGDLRFGYDVVVGNGLAPMTEETAIGKVIDHGLPREAMGRIAHWGKLLS